MAIENVSFTLEIDSGNAALADNPTAEIARLLRVAAGKVTEGNERGILLDTNGTKVGDFVMEIEEKDDEDEDNSDDQDEAENICQNVEHLYDLGREGGSDALEEAFTEYVNESIIDVNVDNVDFVKLCAFLGDDN